MIVFPMAGQARRFTDAGYSQPKYMLPLGEGYAFDYAVRSFISCGRDDDFIFIHRGGRDVENFIWARCRALGISTPVLFGLPEPTRGQAETVELGLRGLGLNSGELWIFNIDTFRANRILPEVNTCGDGYLEVFIGRGDNWSFVLPDVSENRVARTTEKDPVSNLCCTGLYQFSDASHFFSALNKERLSPDATLGEYYVAPLYNHLIRAGKDIRYGIIGRDEVVFCGVPSEYEAILQNPETLVGLKRDE